MFRKVILFLKSNILRREYSIEIIFEWRIFRNTSVSRNLHPSAQTLWTLPNETVVTKLSLRQSSMETWHSIQLVFEDFNWISKTQLLKELWFFASKFNIALEVRSQYRSLIYVKWWGKSARIFILKQQSYRDNFLSNLLLLSLGSWFFKNIWLYVIVNLRLICRVCLETTYTFIWIPKTV